MNFVKTRIAIVEKYLQNTSEHNKNGNLPYIIYAYSAAWREIINNGVDAVDGIYVSSKFDEFDRKIYNLYHLHIASISLDYIKVKRSIEEEEE